MSIIEEIAIDDERVLEEPELLVAVRNLSESSVDILVRPWTNTNNWWRTQLDMKKRIKERFDEEGITLPYPQRDLHFPEQNGELAKSNKEVVK